MGETAGGNWVLFWWVGPCSVQFSHSVVSDSLQPHGLQHTRPPCPSPTPAVYSNSCPLSRWCHPTISFSVIPFSSCFQSFPASGSFPMSRLLASGGQSIGASVPVLPMKIQGWFSLVLTGLIFLQSKGSQESSPTPQFKSINSSVLSFLYSPTLTSLHDRKIEHIYNFNKHCQVILKESEFIYAPSISMLCLSSCVVFMCIMKSEYYQFLQYLLEWWLKRCYTVIWHFVNY